MTRIVIVETALPGECWITVRSVFEKEVEPRKHVNRLWNDPCKAYILFPAVVQCCKLFTCYWKWPLYWPASVPILIRCNEFEAMIKSNILKMSSPPGGVMILSILTLDWFIHRFKKFCLISVSALIDWMYSIWNIELLLIFHLCSLAFRIGKNRTATESWERGHLQTGLRNHWSVLLVWWCKV